MLCVPGPELTHPTEQTGTLAARCFPAWDRDKLPATSPDPEPLRTGSHSRETRAVLGRGALAQGLGCSYDKIVVWSQCLALSQEKEEMNVKKHLS